MKKVVYVIMVALAVYALQGCNNNKNAAGQNAAGLNETKTTGSTAKQAINPGNPPGTGNAPQVAQQVPLKVGSADARFAINLAEGSLTEIARSVIALQLSKNEKIKALADTLITENRMIYDRLSAIAKIKNIPLPTSVSAIDQKKTEGLTKKTGKGFDKAFLNTIAADCKKAMDLEQEATRKCTDVDLKAFAVKTKSVLQMQINAIAGAQGGA